MNGFLYLLFFIIIVGLLSYRRASLLIFTLSIAFFLSLLVRFFGLGFETIFCIFIFLITFIPLNTPPLRRRLISSHILNLYRQVMPSMSRTEREAIAAGAFDSILLNWEQYLTECTISNVFFVMNGKLRTPALECGLLDGITRSLVIRLAGELNMPIEEGRYTVDQLYRADECFLTNTSMEIMPVTSVDCRPVGDGKPGPLTRKLRAQFVAVRGRF